MDKNVILERLMKGENAEAIAKEFTDMLNEANKEYAEKKEEVQMKEELQDIIDMFVDWLNKYYEVPFKRELRADQVIDFIDSIKEYAAALSDLETLFAKTSASDPTFQPDKVLDDFLKSMKW